MFDNSEGEGMNEKIITIITDYMARNSKVKYGCSGSDDYEILRYGIAVTYYFVIKTVLLIVVSIALNILPYTLTFMLIYGGLRIFARGLHHKSNALCTFMGFINYLVGIFVSINFNISLLITVIIFLACFLLNAIYAPSPTENSPISDREKLPLKIGTLITMGVLFVIMLVIGDNTYRNIILIATVFETLYILPVTYKIFRERRG